MARKEIVYDGITFTISYEILNPKASHDILFLHGWGSNKEVMKQAFKNSFSEYRHLYVDLPGFGQSPTKATLTTNQYAEILKLFLQALSSKPERIVGHSFGGKIATLLTPSTLILLSSAGILKPKSLLMKTKIALAKLSKRFSTFRPLGNLLKSRDVQGMPSNMYETFKQVVDEDFSSKFQESPSTTFIFWGREDSITPLWCGAKIASLIEKAALFPLDGDHYFFLRHAHQIENIVKQGLKLESYTLKVTGIVQGVGYRKFTHRIAQEKGIKGHVKNLSDGSVIIECTLETSQYQPFLDELYKGPMRSKVERIEIKKLATAPLFRGFEILY